LVHLAALPKLVHLQQITQWLKRYLLKLSS